MLISSTLGNNPPAEQAASTKAPSRITARHGQSSLVADAFQDPRQDHLFKRDACRIGDERLSRSWECPSSCSARAAEAVRIASAGVEHSGSDLHVSEEREGPGGPGPSLMLAETDEPRVIQQGLVVVDSQCARRRRAVTESIRAPTTSHHEFP